MIAELKNSKEELEDKVEFPESKSKRQRIQNRGKKD